MWRHGEEQKVMAGGGVEWSKTARIRELRFQQRRPLLKMRCSWLLNVLASVTAVATVMMLKYYIQEQYATITIRCLETEWTVLLTCQIHMIRCSFVWVVDYTRVTLDWWNHSSKRGHWMCSFCYFSTMTICYANQCSRITHKSAEVSMSWGCKNQ